ncbi:hypothetical protein FRUB_02758 [Fimbriiglobus ruber]|uniref:Uncharacterized protein n=1 Tax=Fimbriiglobus ruber TaxID=1908690 RepID=A0A225E0Y8_9BACT|nr:hypothetical protein FRUB_02758 [Fimbriiglobus ruber]
MSTGEADMRGTWIGGRSFLNGCGPAGSTLPYRGPDGRTSGFRV